jgi:hypothetical protein
LTKVKEMATGKEIKRLRGGETSAAKAAALIGVGVDRLRKWEERDVDPSDTADIEKVEAYFGCALNQLKNIKDFEFVKRPVTRVEIKEMPDIAGIHDDIKEVFKSMLRQHETQTKISERLDAIQAMLQEIGRKLEGLTPPVPQKPHGKDGDRPAEVKLGTRIR